MISRGRLGALIALSTLAVAATSGREPKAEPPPEPEIDLSPLTELDAARIAAAEAKRARKAAKRNRVNGSTPVTHDEDGARK